MLALLLCLFQASTQTDAMRVPMPRRRQMKNKSVLCRPFTMDQESMCQLPTPFDDSMTGSYKNKELHSNTLGRPAVSPRPDGKPSGFTAGLRCETLGMFLCFLTVKCTTVSRHQMCISSTDWTLFRADRGELTIFKLILG